MNKPANLPVQSAESEVKKSNGSIEDENSILQQSEQSSISQPESNNVLSTENCFVTQQTECPQGKKHVVNISYAASQCNDENLIYQQSAAHSNDNQQGMSSGKKNVAYIKDLSDIQHTKCDQVVANVIDIALRTADKNQYGMMSDKKKIVESYSNLQQPEHTPGSSKESVSKNSVTNVSTVYELQPTPTVYLDRHKEVLQQVNKHHSPKFNHHLLSQNHDKKYSQCDSRHLSQTVSIQTSPSLESIQPENIRYLQTQTIQQFKPMDTQQYASESRYLVDEQPENNQPKDMQYTHTEYIDIQIETENYQNSTSNTGQDSQIGMNQFSQQNYQQQNILQQSQKDSQYNESQDTPRDGLTGLSLQKQSLINQGNVSDKIQTNVSDYQSNTQPEISHVVQLKNLPQSMSQGNAKNEALNRPLQLSDNSGKSMSSENPQHYLESEHQYSKRLRNSVTCQEILENEHLYIMQFKPQQRKNSRKRKGDAYSRKMKEDTSKKGTKILQKNQKIVRKHSVLKGLKSDSFDAIVMLQHTVRQQSEEYSTGLRHKCEICDKHFTRYSGLKEHRMTHTGETQFLCNVCGKKFINKSNLRRHLLVHTGAKPHGCEKCGKNFSSATYVRWHKAKFHNEGKTSIKQHKCGICGKKFDKLSSLSTHIYVHTAEKPHKCHICLKGFTAKLNLSRHLKLKHAVVGQYMCKECGIEFESSTALRNHKSEHAVRGPFKCSICGKEFLSFKWLKNHKIKHSVQGPYKCGHCTMDFPTVKLLRLHKLIHLLPKVNKCSVCDKEFTSSAYLSRHLMIHSDEKPYSCDICSRKFQFAWSLNIHKMVHTKEKQFKCDICGKQFKMKYLHIRHMAAHSRKKFYKCKVCKKQFPVPSSLERHMISHTGEKPFECEQCGKKFTRPAGLRDHMMIHSGETRYKCDVCNKTFRNRSNHKRHMLVHTGEKPYTCEKCGKGFTSSQYMRWHLAHFHTDGNINPKPHVCGICGKQFSRLKALSTHLFVHTEEKPHKCEICNKGFTAAINLTRHLRCVHSVGGPFRCYKCGEMFSTPELLQSHKAIHTGPNPNVCYYCGKVFPHPSSLKRHVKKHSDDRPFKCDFCEKRFKFTSNVKDHVRIMHKDQCVQEKQ